MTSWLPILVSETEVKSPSCFMFFQILCRNDKKSIVGIEYQFLFCRSVDNWENESDYVAENLKWSFLIVLNLPSSQLSYFLHFIWFYFSLIVIGRNQLENQMHDELVFWYIFFYPFHLWAENILGAHNW